MSSDELTQPAPADLDPLTVLAGGEVEVLGRMPWSSNATFLVTLHHDGAEARAIYKPGSGERPLWDFPEGLYRREAAAYVLSEAMGVGVVPPTIVRDDAPLGPGSLQWFVEADFSQHYFPLYEERPDLHDQFRRIAVFDLIANNTDRKSGHCLIDATERVWAIDNGLCFSEDFKLRTVIWEFGGEDLSEELIAHVRAAIDGVTSLESLLRPDELAAVIDRAEALLASGRFPIDATGRRYPWPLV
ncbi:MAG: SCO1664 family protein [Ilumatobacteraceae bacterium]